MQEKGPKSLIFQEWGNAVFEVCFIGIGESIPLVGESSEKFGGEFKMRVGSGSLDPTFTHLGGWDSVEGVVELNGIEVLGEISQRVKLRLLWRRINDSFPIIIRPPRRADTDHRKNPFTAEHAENAEMNESLKFQQDPSFL